MKGLSEGNTLVGPLQALLDDEALTPGRGADHDPTLVVEVAKIPSQLLLPQRKIRGNSREHDEDTLTLATESVLDGDLDVVKGDEGSTSGRGLDCQSQHTYHKLPVRRERT